MPFRKIQALVQPGDRLWFYGLAVMTVVNALVEVTGIASIVPFLSVASDPASIHSNRYLNWAYETFSFTSANDFLFALGVGVFVVVLGRNAFSAVFFWLRARFAARFRHLLGTALLASYLRQPYSAFLNRNSSELIRNILAEATNAAGVLRASLELLAHGVATLSILVLLIMLDPQLALTVALLMGVAYGLVWSVVRKLLRTIGEERFVANKARFKISAEAFGAMKETKLLGGEHYFERAFAKPDWRYLRHEATNTLVATLPKFVLEAVAFGGVVVVVLYLLATHDDFLQTIPLIGIYTFAGYRLMPALQGALTNASYVRFNRPSLDQVYDDIVAEQHVTRPFESGRRHVEEESDRGRSAITFSVGAELRDVTFDYPGANSPSLTEVSLKIPKNGFIGLVGRTGSGKTTALDLLLGLLRPSQGGLFVDGEEVSDEQLPAWQAKLGYVPQDVYLADDTIRRNIAFAVPDDEIDDEAVRRAATIANIADFIERELPAGYETVVGERGVRMSGGQRQRVGIARALYRDPEILFFDEATSALDSATEEAIVDAVERLSSNRTIVQIAHRVATLRNCDCIYVLEDGRVVAQGTYTELLSSSAAFRSVSQVESH